MKKIAPTFKRADLKKARPASPKRSQKNLRPHQTSIALRRIFGLLCRLNLCKEIIKSFYRMGGSLWQTMGLPNSRLASVQTSWKRSKSARTCTMNVITDLQEQIILTHTLRLLEDYERKHAKFWKESWRVLLSQLIAQPLIVFLKWRSRLYLLLFLKI